MTQAAYLADGQPVSREAFYTLACDPQRSVVVEACAGAGKTWMLVSRILRALLDGAQPQEILAITFTRKAAGEMRDRLHEWLREFAAPTMSDERRAAELVLRGMAPQRAAELAPTLAGLYERVLASGRSVEIRTFHAWFSQLLRAAPLDLLAELGLAPGMTLMEELDDHRAAVLRRFHAAIVADASLKADHAALVRRRGRDQVQAWFQSALDKRVELELADQAGTLESSVPPPDCEGHPCDALLGERWRASVGELARALGQGKATAQKAANALVDAMALPDAQARFAALRAALFTKEGSPRKQLGDAATLADVLADLDAIERQRRQHEAHAEHLQLVRLSRVLLRELTHYKRARGLADMADLERCALALLRDATLSGWVQERLDTRIRHVLIDEFQDTSPLQWHALHSWLSAYAGAGGGASGQRPPGVFIVGDPKQSIYRFRRAEPRVFAAARHFVTEGLGGAWLACDHTRRNAPEVLDAINHVFSGAVGSGEYAGFRPHTTELAPVAHAGVTALPVVPRPPKTAKGEAAPRQAWRDSLVMPRHEPEALLREQEARHVAHAVHELVRSGAARPGEIFVLCRKRASLRLAGQALQALHLPYAAADDHALMDAPEVRDLVALLDVLASPQHRLSLAHALRSPVFGASDDDLISLAGRAEQGDWWSALLHSDHGERSALARASRLLRGWREAAHQLPPHDLLDRIVHEGDVRARVAAVVPAEQRLAALNAIDALLAQSLTLDGARYATPYNFVRALKRRLLKVSAPVQADAVQLLTVHGAKGLEAKVVFVMDAQPEASNGDTATLLVDWPVEDSHPARCAFIYSESQCPPSLQGAMDEELAARRREELNGLYVAMTRARERLVFSRTEPHRVTPSWWDRVAPTAQAWSPEPPPAAAPERAVGQVRLRELPRWERPAAPPRPTPSPDTDATRLGSAVHRTLEWAAAAVGEGAAAAGEGADLSALADAAAAEFGAPAAEVARVAGAIWRSPQCRRFFAGEGLRWGGNEVPVSEGGEVLRIDRLVQVDQGGRSVWWVLDYKLAAQPQEQAAYREQMLRYRRAVMALQPGDEVRCALINGQGSVIEIT